MAVNTGVLVCTDDATAASTAAASLVKSRAAAAACMARGTMFGGGTQYQH